MVKREIKKFELNIEGGSYPCTAPCSAKSVLSSFGANVDGVCSSVSFETVIPADELALSIKNFYLRVGGIKRPADIYLGEEKLCSCDGITPVYYINLTGKLEKGDNPLSVRFSNLQGDLSYIGLSESFEILRFGGAIIEDMFVRQQHSEGKVTLGVDLSLLGDTSSVRAVATLISPVGQIYYAGLTGGKGSIIIPDPLYWWPAGLGVQNLYRLTVNIYGDTDIEDSMEKTVGLCDFNTEDGNSFTVQGQLMLPMGAVYISDPDPDFILAEKRIEAKIKSASAAGYNCLLVPRYSDIPFDKFYELCDSYGIVVVEEHSDVSPATLGSLRARAHHPCLRLVDIAADENESLDKSAISEKLGDVKAIMRDSFPEYITSPTLPSMKSIRTVIPEGERSLFSRSVEAIADEGEIKKMLLSVADKYPYPHDLSGFAYASALASAHLFADVVKESRLTRGGSGRAIFNHLCDFSFEISSSAIDYRGRWKPLQYYCSRMFAPLTLYAEANGGSVLFSVSNLRRQDFIGTLEYRIADASNYTVFRASESIEISSMSEGEVHTADISEIITGHESEYYLEYCLKEGALAISKKVLLFLPEKHYDFKKPNIKTEIKGQDKSFSITVSADKLVKDLEIGFDGVDAVFSDNYIDLTSEAPVKIDFTISGASQKADHLAELLELRSVWDLK